MAERGLTFELARVTLEFTSPVTVGVYGQDDFADVICVSDANGLPTIPGSSLAGVLRHLLAGDEDVDKSESCKEVFGYQRGNLGQASALEVSWGQIHGTNDLPVPMFGATMDDFLAFIATGVTRDHVRINGFGAVDGNGKFDVRSAPAGCRFTFELVLHQKPNGQVPLSTIIGLFDSPRARLGGQSRRGLGSFKVVRAQHRKFDLTQALDREAFAKLPRGLHQPVPKGLLRDLETPSKNTSENEISLQISPGELQAWMIGGGDEAEDAMANQRLRAPLREARIQWNKNSGSISEASYLLPASALKGPLRHRTLYHVRRRLGVFDGVTEGRSALLVEVLFGEAKADAEGRPGLVYFSDVWLDSRELQRFDHVSIDRFSGGPLDGHLFGEKALMGTSITTTIQLDYAGLQERLKRPEKRFSTEKKTMPRDRAEPFSPSEKAIILAAFRDALEDLTEGRLALGAGANRGYGYFEGALSWPQTWEVAP